jgi:DNA-binding beta-propeller fold protein YncE
MRLRHALGLGVSLLAAASTARAECELHGPETGPVGDTLTLSLECSPAPDTTLHWDFGDGDTLTGTRSLTVRHAFAKPGRYNVFVRVPGVLIPYSRYQSVLYPVAGGRSAKSSSLVYDAARKRVWAANADNHTVTAVDAATFQVVWEKPVGRNPRSLALDADGALWVVNQDDATLSVLDGTDGSALATLPLPYASRPFGLAVGASGKIGYLSLEATGRLLKIDLAKRAILDSLSVCPSPRAVAVSHDGARIYVGRFISPSDQGEVHVVETNPFRKAGMLPLRPDVDPGLEIGTNGRGVPNALTSIAFSPDGRYAYVTAKKDNTARGLFRDGRPLTFETSVRAVACRLDLAAGKEDFAARVDIDNTSQPSDVAFTRSGSLAFVSTQGSNRVAALDPQGAPVIGIFRSPDFSGPTYAHVLGPVALALDARDSLLFVQYALSRELGVFDVSGVQQGGEAPRIALVKTVAKEALDPQVLFGKQIFGNSGDTRMSREGYTSCAACHMEGGTDGRVWDFTDRGEGLRRHRHGPGALERQLRRDPGFRARHPRALRRDRVHGRRGFRRGHAQYDPRRRQGGPEPGIGRPGRLRILVGPGPSQPLPQSRRILDGRRRGRPRDFPTTRGGLRALPWRTGFHGQQAEVPGPCRPGARGRSLHPAGVSGA